MRDFGFDCKRIELKNGNEISSALSDFYSLFEGRLVTWLASLWDRDSGGFYFSNSARDTEGYDPDIESTGQAMGILQDLGITLDPVTFPGAFKDKVVNYFRDLQDPDGFFYHKKWGKDINTSRRARDLASATGWIKMLGGTLKYPSAIEQMKEASSSGEQGKSSIPEHLRSRDAFIKYLDGLNVSKNSYSAGQIIAMQAPQIKATGLSDVCIDYLNSIQLDNGIWESELNYASANGMLKICHAYNALGRDLPRLPSVVGSTVATIFNPDEPKAIVDVFNPLMALHYLRSIVKNTGSPERLALAERIISERGADILTVTREKLSIFRQPDGSFSYYKVGYVYGDGQWSQGKIVAPGVDEGNVNASQLANACRILITEALSLEVGLPYTVCDGEEIFKMLK